MNEHINRQDVQIQNQEKRIKEQQMYIRGQDIHIRKHNRQINELSEHIYKQEGVAMNNKSQIPSVSIVKGSLLTQAEPGESVNHFNHSFRGKALRRSIKAIPGKKTGKWKEKTSVTKRLESGISSINMVAFYAYMNTGEEHPGQHQILVFDVIKTNVGLAYNKHNGMFSAPNHGYYVLTWTVACGTYSAVYSQLVINSDPFGSIFTNRDEINDIHTVTGMVVAELNQGDVVYIRTHPTDRIKGRIISQDDIRTSFAGWKIF
ncbi:uncharacterized protein [Mytilus edulis]|uniref:uncharacterized protein n=1 Tax=Mytilus edulis TaxID=6550 RepID=UPI0039EF3251